MLPPRPATSLSAVITSGVDIFRYLDIQQGKWQHIDSGSFHSCLPNAVDEAHPGLPACDGIPAASAASS